MLFLQTILPLALLASSAVHAHPGHDVTEEAAERAAFLKRNTRTIRSCANQLKARGHDAASLKRREQLASKIRAKRGLAGVPQRRRRAVTDYDFSHNSTDSSLSLDSDVTAFFDNSSCILQPEVTQGPYYVNGELIRNNIVESESGVSLHLDIQIIDTSTCEPVSDLYMDLWHCNATGVYSGVVANGNGDSSDTSNLDNTALRGIQQTDSDGVVQFETVFPGHYTGRATHIHMMTHSPNYTVVQSNNTLLGDDPTTVHANHVGQLFFDQDLIAAVDTVEPYASNSQTVTENTADSILGEEADSMDPFVEYMYLGNSLDDGLLAWVSIGIDMSADNEVSAAAVDYETGGVANSNGMGGMGGGGGSGGPPSGASGGPGNGTAMGSLTGAPSGSGANMTVSLATATAASTTGANSSSVSSGVILAETSNSGAQRARRFW